MKSLFANFGAAVIGLTFSLEGAALVINQESVPVVKMQKVQSLESTVYEGQRKDSLQIKAKVFHSNACFAPDRYLKKKVRGEDAINYELLGWSEERSACWLGYDPVVEEVVVDNIVWNEKNQDKTIYVNDKKLQIKEVNKENL